jgi:hypothetical protein
MNTLVRLKELINYFVTINVTKTNRFTNLFPLKNFSKPNILGFYRETVLTRFVPTKKVTF